MKKVWLQRDHVYNYKPFYKQKLKISLLAFFVVTIIYFGYQIFYFNKLITNSMETTQILVEDSQDDNFVFGQQLKSESPLIISSNYNITRYFYYMTAVFK